MTKNTCGGKKAKGLARKNINAAADANNPNSSSGGGALRVSTSEHEIYAQAIRVLGGQRATAVDLHGRQVMVYIPGKFRTKNRRDNFIAPNTWLLLGVRDWETPKKDALPTLDLIEVYKEHEKQRLRSTVTTVDWSLFLVNDAKSVATGTATALESDVIFSNEIDEEVPVVKRKPAADATESSYSSSAFVFRDELGNEISVEDI